MTRTEEVAFYCIERLEENNLRGFSTLRQATEKEAKEASIALAGFSNNENTIEATVYGSADKKLKVVELRKDDFHMKFALTNKQFRQLHNDICFDE